MRAARETLITNELITTKQAVNAVKQPGCTLVAHTQSAAAKTHSCNGNDYLYVDIVQSISEPLVR